MEAEHSTAVPADVVLPPLTSDADLIAEARKLAGECRCERALLLLIALRVAFAPPPGLRWLSPRTRAGLALLLLVRPGPFGGH